MDTPPSDFAAVYERYATDVFRFVVYLSGNRADADDITAETFVHAFTAPERIEASTVKAYLFTIARHLFLHGLRRRARQTSLPENLRDPAASPSDRVQAKSELDAVIAKLQTLPEVDRAALLMRALQDLPYQDIARALDISVSSAKVKVHRARKALMNLRLTTRASAPEEHA